MSDDKIAKREWQFYITDMIDFAEKVLTYTEGMNQETFIKSGITFDAVLRRMV